MIGRVTYLTNMFFGATSQVRSSSRLGYLDFQVNAKRLNYIAEKLRAAAPERFQASDITSKTHPEYFEANKDNK